MNNFVFNFMYISECAEFRHGRTFTLVFTFHINATSSTEYKVSQTNLLQFWFELIIIKE